MATMLVTRPEPDASETAGRLAALGIKAIKMPLLVRHALATGLPEVNGLVGMALTSANAILALAETGRLAPYLDLKVFAVGERTGQAARNAGFADVTVTGTSLAGLIEHITAAKLTGPLFYPSAQHPSGDLARSLAPAGVLVVQAKIYEMKAITEPPEAQFGDIKAGKFSAALFYSRRTADTFVKLARQALARPARANLGVLCLSENIAEPLLEAGFVRAGLADYPSEEAMMALAMSFARDENRA